MGIVFRQSAKSTIVIFAGAVLGAVINLVYTYVLSKAELGLITNLTNQAAIAQVGVLTGLAYLLVTYFSRFPENDQKKKVLLTICFGFPIFTLIAFSVPYFLLKEKILNLYQIADRPLISRYYFLLPVIVTGWAYTTLLDHYLVSRMKSAAGALIRELVLRAGTIIIIGLFFFRIIDFQTFVVLLSLTYLLPVFIGFYLAQRTFGFGFSLKFTAFSRAEYRQLFSFSAYHLLEGVSVTLMGYIDALMLAPLSSEGLSDLSVYRNAIFVAGLMIMPFRAMSAASFPIFNSAYVENRTKFLEQFYQRTSLNTATLGIILFAIIGSNLDNLVMIFPKGYESIKDITLILILGKLVQMICGLSSELISLTKYYRFNFFISLMLLIAIVTLNRLLIPEYGIWGAAWSVTGALIVYNIVKVIFIQKKLKIRTHSYQIGIILIFGLVAGGVGWLLPFMIHPIIDACVRTTFSGVIYGALLMKFLPASDFSRLLRNIILHRRLR